MEPPITVAELIAILQGFPPDAVVLYTACSVYNPLEAREVLFYPKTGSPYQRRGQEHRSFMVHHKGTYMLCDESWQEKGNEEPYIDAVTLPGN